MIKINKDVIKKIFFIVCFLLPIHYSSAEGYYEGETITLIMRLDASAGGSTVGGLMPMHLALN